MQRLGYAPLCGALLLGLSGVSAKAQTAQEVKDAFEMMVGSAAICADYLGRPEILTDNRKLGHQQFEKVGVSVAEADAFMDTAVAEALKEPSTETQKQVACEIINIPALK